MACIEKINEIVGEYLQNDVEPQNSKLIDSSETYTEDTEISVEGGNIFSEQKYIVTINISNCLLLSIIKKKNQIQPK